MTSCQYAGYTCKFRIGAFVEDPQVAKDNKRGESEVDHLGALSYIYLKIAQTSKFSSIKVFKGPSGLPSLFKKGMDS